MDHVDVYLFPCRSKSASAQVHEMVNYLISYNATYGMIWIDLETNPSPGCGYDALQTPDSFFFAPPTLSLCC